MSPDGDAPFDRGTAILNGDWWRDGIAFKTALVAFLFPFLSLDPVTRKKKKQKLGDKERRRWVGEGG